MQNNKFSSLPWFFTHFLAVLLISLALALIRYPFFLNSDYFFGSDEGMLASTILNLLNGGPIIFYFDFGRTFGLTFGLLASPFIWILGPTSLAFFSPGVLYYGLYIWTTYLIAKILIPRSAYLILILMFFTPPFITSMTFHNWPHTLSAFLGNLIFLLFIKLKLSEKNIGPIIFTLFFIMGLAIYTYTYSLIYILTISILYTLSHPLWNQVRENISINTAVIFLKNKKTKTETLCLFLDVLIILFFIAVIFSYVFGGFGLDIAGHSILQINKFHNAAMQLLVIIFLRILINPKSSISFFRKTKSFFVTRIQSKKKNTVAIGLAGFLIGLSPRIASILMGETSRGGQGHDVDFLPTKLFVHLQDLLTEHGPQLLGFGEGFQSMFSNSNGIGSVILGTSFILLAVIFFCVVFSLVFENRTTLRNILSLRSMPFKGVHIFLLLPILVCAANIIVQHGPETRYLFPLFGVATLWVGMYVDKIKEKYKWFPISVLAIWICFYSFTNYLTFQETGLIEENKVVKLKKHFIHSLVGFLEAEKIAVAYSDYGTAGSGSYLSGGRINISEYSANPVYKTAQRVRSMTTPRFAIIAKDNHATTYQNYLQENKIDYKTATVSEYEIFWDFSGDDTVVQNLRSLISN